MIFIKRLDGFLVSQNICSRSEAKKMISKKRVAVNGVTVTKADTKLNPESDTVTVDGKTVEYRKFVYIMLNKPSGVLSATQDNNDKTVIDILPDNQKFSGLFPVGRLDKDTEGLLIITNDGEYAHNVLSPKKHVFKTYSAKTDKPITAEAIENFKNGIVFADGTKCQPAYLSQKEGDAIISICEGKFHQVKKMLKTQGIEVLYLKRLSMGKLELDAKLSPGESKLLTFDEAKLALVNKIEA